ncbi:hypothetical protein FNV43_RR24824 [Rhamnella rubrinervis]|uniref:Uncharacterized protein n=1 Tax=Rhamnella rubrinervis TaxID=2594499 RepID=A0A8K0GQK9_9ROSA|nr:hypothetical protein FNV43_RR24824 [Rhamnella rubrinervis]
MASSHTLSLADWEELLINVDWKDFFWAITRDGNGAEHLKKFLREVITVDSLLNHSVGVDEERSSPENYGSQGSYDILTIEDVSPIESARERFLRIIVDHFIGDHLIEVNDSDVDDAAQSTQDKPNKRKTREVQFEGDPEFVLPLMYVANMYETLAKEVNIRLGSLSGLRGKTIGVALEAAGGLYRSLAKKFPQKGPRTYKRTELKSKGGILKRFPELVIGEDKPVHFVIVNGLDIVENPNMPMDDAEWFKRLTGRNEVSVSAQDYKFYFGRHKNKSVASNSVSNIPTSLSNKSAKGFTDKLFDRLSSRATETVEDLKLDTEQEHDINFGNTNINSPMFVNQPVTFDTALPTQSSGRKESKAKDALEKGLSEVASMINQLIERLQRQSQNLKGNE